jgi:hypothetical protein
MFVTSQGSAYSHFKRALERRNFLLAWTLAAELPKVQLADALSLLLLALDQQPWRFETAAPRWHARLCAEARADPPRGAACPRRAPGPRRSRRRRRWSGSRRGCSAHGLDDAVEVLDAWLDAHD